MKIALALVASAGIALAATPAHAAPAAPSPNPGPVAPAANTAPAAAPALGAGAAADGRPAAGAPGAAAAAPAGGAPAAAGGGAPAAAGGAVAPAGAGRPAAPAAGAPVPVATGGNPVLVARYTFDAGAVDGRVADTSGRGQALSLRGADQGVVRFETSPQGGRHLSFPAACQTGARACPRGLLEAPSDPDLNPGTRMFRWSARVQVTRAQIAGSANIMQKGVATTVSQWKMQIGATNGRAQCVVVGNAAKTAYVARSTASVADGQWHKILCQRSGTSLAVFVDGVQRGQTTIPANLAVSNSLPLRIGGPNFNTRSDMYHGRLDDVYAELG